MTDVDLKQREVEVLDRLESYGRPTVTTLREAIWWADENQHVHYRLDKLEERELVETWKDDDGEFSGPLPPRRAKLTESGSEVLEMIDEDEARPDDLEGRVEQLEKQVGAMASTYREIKERIVQTEEDLEDVDGDVDDVVEDVRNLRRAVEQIPMFGADEDEFEFADGD
jgi:DNA-binding PadR family transcriptional regulator